MLSTSERDSSKEGVEEGAGKTCTGLWVWLYTGTNTSWEWERLRMILTVEGKWIMEVASFLHPPHPMVISQTHP